MVIYFSGNGNSKAIAVSIAQNLSCEIVPLEGDILVNPRTAKLTCHDNVIVWVFPVYSWGVPPVVVNFIENCEIECDKKCTHHLVVSCGDDTGLTATQWRRLMTSRGWISGSSTSVIMPNTYVLMKGFDTDSKEIEQKKLSESHIAIQNAVTRIRENRSDDMMLKGKFAWIKSRIIYPWFTRYAMSPKPFHTTEKCISCGKCANDCPMQNIKMNNGRPEWSNDCALCLRCYHHCPKQAIAYGKATNGKHQYKNW